MIKKQIVSILKKSVAPISSAVLFGLTIMYWNGQNYGLALEYNGKQIAAVTNDKIVEEANKMISDQIPAEKKETTGNVTPKMKLTPIVKRKCSASPTELKEKLIEKSNEIITEGYGVYVNENLITIGNNETEIQKLFEALKQEKKQLYPEFEVDFCENIEIKKGIFSHEEFKNISDISKILRGDKTEYFEYTVKDTDTIESISQEFNLTPKEVMESANNEDGLIFTGETLTLKKITKLLNFTIFRFDTEEKSLPFETEILEDDSRSKNYRETIREGSCGKAYVLVKNFVNENGEIQKEEIKSETVEEPISEQILQGTKKEEPGLIWPVPFTKNVTSGFGMRNGKMHKGIDISSSGVGGKDIIAADDGVVESVVHSGKGYGNCVIIKHADGKETLYAHCSSICISQNAKVRKGEKIATVGSTGDSSGNHLHFEVRVNKESKNPQKYVH